MSGQVVFVLAAAGGEAGREVLGEVAGFLDAGLVKPKGGGAEKVFDFGFPDGFGVFVEERPGLSQESFEVGLGEFEVAFEGVDFLALGEVATSGGLVFEAGDALTGQGRVG